MAQSKGKLTVYYDGYCPKCINDRKFYERLAGKKGKEVCWRDITGKDDELRRIGIDPHKALTELHLGDENQQFHSEMDAYIALMRRLWALKPLAWLIGLPLIRPLVSRIYHWQVERRLRMAGRLED